MICLNMIVKNETRILERCLRSLAPYISCYVIGDTGSTDGTQQMIRDFFDSRGIPGEIHEFEFRSFEYARNRALELAKASPMDFEYLLLCDADMELVADDPKWHQQLNGQVFKVEQRAGIAYWNTRMLSRHVRSKYVGVTHEYLETDGPSVNFRGFHYIDHACGSNRADKFLRDARLLEDALKTEPDNKRYWFYLAQSWRDAHENQRALECYRHRVELGGWAEEAWYSAFQVGVLLERMEKPAQEVVQAYLEAYRLRPTRAEPLHAIARYYRMKVPESAAMSYLYALTAVQISRPEDILFVDDSVYRWRAKDELSVAAYWTGRYQQSIQYAVEVLMEKQCPESDRKRNLSNLLFSVEKRNAQHRAANAGQQIVLEIETGHDLDSLVSRLAYALLHHPDVQEFVFIHTGAADATNRLADWIEATGRFFKVSERHTETGPVAGSTESSRANGRPGDVVLRYTTDQAFSVAEILAA